MSRPNAASARSLSLTEELEKLEQSITLTLQGWSEYPTTEADADKTIEIDHNFSRAHRIVTSSILPIVEQYADHSKAVWEGSKVSGAIDTENKDTDGGVVLETILRSQRQCLVIWSRRTRGRGRRDIILA